MNAFRDIRVIPVVVVAIFGLAVLKVAGLVVDGGYVFDDQPSSTRRSWAQDNLNFPSGRTFDRADITGSVEAKKEESKKDDAKKDEPKKEEPKPAVGTPGAAKAGVITIPEQGQSVSPSERAILERLQSRRQELEARAREIDIRESLLKSAEKRIEGRVEEMKGIESRIATATEQKGEAEAARFKGLVTMYENMKPKDAAKVFDRLEMPVLFEIASKIAPRKMSDILGQMSPQAAERLTVELARRASGDTATAAGDLPKIEGKPTPQARN
ncbi:MotE family protein [Nitrobacter sp. JJSN]|uniref:MotE family protein n=1 Tax=Nitrobacter sp. JJSN TaxID=3453033 RepID=UPI003F75C439